MNTSSNSNPLKVPSWPFEKNATLVSISRERARQTPDGVPFVFVDHSSGVVVDCPISYAVLDVRARQIAALLQTRAHRGDRVLLLYPSGIEYLCAFFGCMYAGMIAVPAYPPLNARLGKRLAAVAADCRAVAAITTAQALALVGDRQGFPPALANIAWLATDVSLDGFEQEACDVDVSRSDIALLQYTSGSTGTPKGVILDHGNLVSNALAIALHMDFHPHDSVFSWLPPYHDMGLIGNLLAPFAAGVAVAFMSPIDFIKTPSRWLLELTKRRATLSGAPNFAYELCVNRISDDELSRIDLSSWTLAFCGAEPIQLKTLERFEQRFRSKGFQATAFYPCYGMAETTLIVSGIGRADRPSCLSLPVDSERNVLALHMNERLRPPQNIVSCGAVVDGLDVQIVVPGTTLLVVPGQVGEILVAGASVSRGYWERDEQNEQSFGQNIEGISGDYMRTGDLGLMSEDELYICGRLKDVIIVHGVNHYPQDIEFSVDTCHEAIRKGCGICFSVESEHGEKIVFVQEIDKSLAGHTELLDEIIAAIRHGIYAQHHVTPTTIALIENGSINKTTSGKLARQPCKRDFFNGKHPVLAHWTNADKASTPAAPMAVNA